jgi:hypothetical protein
VEAKVGGGDVVSKQGLAPGSQKLLMGQHKGNKFECIEDRDSHAYVDPHGDREGRVLQAHHPGRSELHEVVDAVKDKTAGTSHTRPKLGAGEVEGIAGAVEVELSEETR